MKSISKLSSWISSWVGDGQRRSGCGPLLRLAVLMGAVFFFFFLAPPTVPQAQAQTTVMESR